MTRGRKHNKPYIVLNFAKKGGACSFFFFILRFRTSQKEHMFWILVFFFFFLFSFLVILNERYTVGGGVSTTNYLFTGKNLFVKKRSASFFELVSIFMSIVQKNCLVGSRQPILAPRAMQKTYKNNTIALNLTNDFTIGKRP